MTLIIRYYEGKYKVARLSKGTPLKTAKYMVLEEFATAEEGIYGDSEHMTVAFHQVGDIMVLPYRRCTKERKK
jgi:hypothetical protein